MNKFVFRFKKKRIDDDTKLSMSIMSIFIILMIQYFVLMIFNIYGTSVGTTVQLTSKLFVGIFFINSLNIVIRRSLRFAFMIYIIAIIITLINYLAYPHNWVYLNDILTDVFLLSLPCLIYAYSIKDIKKLLKAMEIASLITFFVGLLLWISIIFGNTYIGSYSMSFSYYLLLPAIFYINKYFEEKKISDLIISFLSLILILSIGSRGPIVSFLIFIALYTLFSAKKLSYKKSLGYITITAMGFMFLAFIDKIFIRLSYFFERVGINSRSIRLFLQNDIHLSGRDNLYTNVLEAIVENPLLGIGIAGDRYILNGAYSHNIFLELLSGFGIIMGIFISAIIIIFLVVGLFTKEHKNQIVFMLWICLGFIPLLFTGSYLISYRFWIFIGLILGFIRNKKRVKG